MTSEAPIVTGLPEESRESAPKLTMEKPTKRDPSRLVLSDGIRRSVELRGAVIITPGRRDR